MVGQGAVENKQAWHCGLGAYRKQNKYGKRK